MIGQSLIGQPIERPGLRIGFKLPIPGSGIELHVPTPELGKLLCRKRRDLLLELLDLGHNQIIHQRPRVCL